MFLRLLIFAFIVMTTSTFAQTPTIDAGVSQTLAKWRGANYSDVRYKLNLTLEKMSPTLKGSIEIRVKLSEPPASAGGSNPTIILDWRKIRGKEDLSTISNVSINGKTLTSAAKPPANAGGSDKSVNFEETNEHLVFKDGVTKGENVVKLDFTSPIATSGAAITRYVDKEDGAEYVYSLFVPSDASTVFPVFDQPDLKARFQLNLKAYGNWKVISNTQPTRIQKITPTHSEDARKNLHETSFVETQPISTYVFAFAAGEFAEFEDAKRETISFESTEDITKNNGLMKRIYSEVPKIYVRKSQAEKFKQHATETFRLNGEAVKYLESYFDYKFPFPKYDLVLIPEFPFGGMEHAGATFLRESSVIFPSEPTANDYISRANLIFHEAAHQWFGDTVTMKWFDDLWLKEGFAEFMAYKTLEKVLPEYNAWKAFYERNKPLAYLTDSTKGTTPIYQEIPNLSQAKSAYGNIVYRKAPSFLRQAEFYLGEDKFQTAVRAFLKKHEFANAEWTDLVKEFETASEQDLKDWANVWVKKRGMPIIRVSRNEPNKNGLRAFYGLEQKDILNQNIRVDETWKLSYKILEVFEDGEKQIKQYNPPTLDNDIAAFTIDNFRKNPVSGKTERVSKKVNYIFPNYQDYGYGIFLLDEKSRDYVLKNIQNEPDDFLRSMMWGTLWDSVREAELAPGDYVTLAIKNIGAERDELTIQTILGRVSTAMNYYLPDTQSKELAAQFETLLLDKMQNAPTLGQRITFYRAFLNVASTDKAKQTLKDVLSGKMQIKDLKLKTKDKFDIATKLLILSDKDAPNLLAELEKTETSDEAKRYAYAAKAGIATAENKQKFFSDFTNNKEISESYIETAFAPFNSSKHAELTLPFLENALKELPNLRRSRKIFFVNGWLSAFIGGQKSAQALQIVNKFLTDNPNLDRDLRLKVLEVVDGLERAVKIRNKFSKT
jgi:aminopeptidase N